MSKKRDISPEERALFRETLGNITRHQHDQVIHLDLPKSPIVVNKKRDQHEANTIADTLSDGFDPHIVDADEILHFMRAGLQKTVMRKLKRGQYRIGDEIDLHGYSVTEARPALAHFLQRAVTDDIRCVRIIHGKGNNSNQQPIIKNKVNAWLRQSHHVLAFCSAKKQDGGTGAVYVLLRKGNEQLQM